MLTQKLNGEQLIVYWLNFEFTFIYFVQNERQAFFY